MKVLLDTSVILSDRHISLPDVVAISTASLAELHFGINVAKKASERSARLRRLAEVESRFESLPVDSAVARSYGALAATLASGGRSPRPRAMDILIAATAQTHKVPLLTMDRGFEAFTEHVDVRFV